MKKLFIILLAITLLPVATAHADVIRYEFDRIIVTFSLEYYVSVEESEKSGWIADVVGDSDSLHILFTQAELYNQDSANPNGVYIIRIKGKYGERTFLCNGWSITENQTVKAQLWSGITLDGLDVVKDYSEPLEVAYVEFIFSPEKAVSGIRTSFFAEDNYQNRVETGYFDGIFAQIGNDKFTDISNINYSGDFSGYLVKTWDIDWAAISEAPIEEQPVDSEEPLVDIDKEIIPEDRDDISDRLKELKLFIGTTTGYQLDSPLTRAQAATILVRLLGEEASVLQEDYPDNPFSDVPDSHWAKNHILYCFENGITNGTSATTFEPERTISSEEFLALVLRLMGYESEPSTSLADSVNTTLLGSGYASRLEASEEFVRGDVVDIMNKALKAPLNTAQPILLAEELIEKEVFTRKQAIEVQLLPAPEEDVLEQINFFASGKLS